MSSTSYNYAKEIFQKIDTRFSRLKVDIETMINNQQAEGDISRCISILKEIRKLSSIVDVGEYQFFLNDIEGAIDRVSNLKEIHQKNYLLELIGESVEVLSNIYNIIYKTRYYTDLISILSMKLRKSTQPHVYEINIEDIELPLSSTEKEELKSIARQKPAYYIKIYLYEDRPMKNESAYLIFNDYGEVGEVWKCNYNFEDFMSNNIGNKMLVILLSNTDDIKRIKQITENPIVREDIICRIKV